MRKLLVLSFITLLGSVAFIACNDEIGDEIPQKIVEPRSDYYQPYDSALAIALRQLDECNPGTRTLSQRTVKEHYLYSPSPSTRATETDPVRFHVINFENGQGFAIVSADKRTTPVYAYSSIGNIDLQEAVQNSGVGVFMESAELYFRDEIERFGGGPLTPFDPDSSLIDLMAQVPVIVDGIECVQRHFTIQDNKDSLLATKWHVGYPYNSFCPTYISNGITLQYLAGCGPVAIGQIMAYHQHPDSYGGYTFNWSAICSDATTTQNDTCKARLINVISNAANAVYTNGTTAITFPNARNAFQLMGYSTSAIVNTMNNIKQDVKNDVVAHRPLLFAGENESTGENHIWVVDGYRSTTYKTTYYYAYYPYPEYKTVTDSETLYYHLNFGRRMNGIGYYLNVYKYEFGKNIKYIKNIKPVN